MSFMKGIFGGGRKGKGTEEAFASHDRSNYAGRSPAREVRPGVSSQEGTSHSPMKDGGHQINGRDVTDEDLDSMQTPFRQKPVSKKDRNLSISRSGRHKYKNKQRLSVLNDDIYSDLPASRGGSGGATSGPTSTSGPSPTSGSSGYRHYSHQLTTSGSPTAV